MQTTLEEKKQGANREANIIIQEAQLKANTEMEDYINKVKNLKAEINLLGKQKLNYFIRFKSFLNSQMEWLNAMESPLDNDDEDNILELNSGEASGQEKPSSISQSEETRIRPDNIEPFEPPSQMIR